jgi:hypothetical protein
VILIAIALLAPLAVYIVVGFSPKARARNETEYFIGGKRVNQNDYANTSVGYALQMAAVFLFATWGILYGIGALWAAVFWGLGYLLLYILLPRFIPYHAQDAPLTLHEYLRLRFRAGRALQLLAAAATVVGLMGTMLAEVDFVVQVLQPVSDAYPIARPVALEAVFLIIGLSYIIWNGFKAEVRAERIQIPIAYCCLLTTLFYLLPTVWGHAGPRAFYPIVVVLGLALIVMTLAKVDWTASKRGTRRLPDWQIIIPLAGLLVLTILTVLTATSTSPGTIPSLFERPISLQLKAQGWLALTSLFLANALWMPVDLSTWQRITSVDRSNVLQVLRAGTLRVALESPAGWFLGGVLGWSIHSSGILSAGADPSEAISSLASYLSTISLVGVNLPIGSVVYATFLAGAVAVMLSTVNSIMSAIAYTVERDVLGGARAKLGRLRLITAGSLLGGFVVFQSLRRVAGASLAILLYGAYSAQLSLIVVVLVALYGIRISAHGAVGSVAAGLAFSSVYVLFAIQIQDPQAFVLPPLFAIGGSVLGYAFFYRETD